MEGRSEGVMTYNSYLTYPNPLLPSPYQGEGAAGG